MASQSLYRKWRSQDFDDIVGQAHVVKTLQNAIKHGRVAHAYLFTGPRGTGKTSTARILAKAVNCLDPQDGGPCTRCEMCVGIAEGRSPDVLEIDGASNNSIDDIRILRERVAFAPAEASFKVYIIDEVHRLSPNAFDGLLKTLEEPPQHVLFIFASTEPHKVPGTIVSRCQRFDFRKIELKDTLARLREVAAQENLEVDSEALLLIAQQSAGSLRDALGILDQVRAFAGEHIDPDQVRQSVGLGRPVTISTLTSCMIEGDAGAALNVIHESVEAGVDPRLLSRQLVEYWRALLLQTSGAGDAVDIDPALQAELPAQSEGLDPSATVDVLRALTENVIEPRLSVSPELPLEIGVISSIIVLHPARYGTAVLRKRDQDSTPGNGNEAQQTPKPPQTMETRNESRVTQTEGHIDEGRGRIREEQTSGAAGFVGEQGPAVKSKSAPSDTGDNTNHHEAKVPDGAQAWPAVLESIRERSSSLQAVLRSATIADWNGTEVLLAFRHRFHRDQTDTPQNRAVVRDAIATITGSRPTVRCVLMKRDSTQSAVPNQIDDTDTFVEDAERMLRGLHARQVRVSKTIS